MMKYNKKPEINLQTLIEKRTIEHVEATAADEKASSYRSLYYKRGYMPPKHMDFFRGISRSLGNEKEGNVIVSAIGKELGIGVQTCIAILKCLQEYGYLEANTTPSSPRSGTHIKILKDISRPPMKIKEGIIFDGIKAQLKKEKSGVVSQKLISLETLTQLTQVKACMRSLQKSGYIKMEAINTDSAQNLHQVFVQIYD
jgi:hypothetical protein